MRPIDEIRDLARSLSAAEFVRRLPCPVFLCRAIAEGTLAEPARPALVRRQGSIPAALRASTLAHAPEVPAPAVPEAAPDLVRRPLPRERWVPVRKGAHTAPKAPITIGRSARCDVVLSDYTVSNLHARARVEPLLGRCVLVDVGTTNGTMLDGKRLGPLEPVHVHSGQELIFGRLVVVLLSAVDFRCYVLEQRLSACAGRSYAEPGASRSSVA